MIHEFVSDEGGGGVYCSYLCRVACSRLREYTSPEAKLRCSPGGPLSLVTWARLPFKSNFSWACLLISSACQMRDEHKHAFIKKIKWISRPKRG